LTKASKIAENERMKLFGTALFLFAASLSFSVKANSVKLYSGANIGEVSVANSLVTTFNTMITEVSGGTNSETEPLLVYIPYDPGVGGLTLDDYVALTDTSSMPQAFAPINAQVNLIFKTTVVVENTDAATLYLYAMVKSPTGTDYTVIKKHASSFSTIESTQAVLQINYQTEICTGVYLDHCTRIDTLGESNDVTFYFFISTDSTLLTNTSLTPASVPGGIFYKLKVNTKKPTGSIMFNGLRPGNGQATADFDGSNVLNMTDLYKVLIFKRFTGVETDIGTLSASLNNKAIVSEFIDGPRTASIAIKGLENSIPVDITLGLMNKYQFVSLIPISRSVTPLKIEQLLESQACFLLTAGFGEEHWVIDYFKHIRDHFLAKFSAGRWFIGAYYETAPKYALKIYHSPSLRLMIRSIAYVAYSFIHFFYLYFAGFVVTWFIIRKWRNASTAKSI
jgi:hypothetical protein